MLLEGVGLNGFPFVAARRVVPKLLVVEGVIDGVETEPVHPAVKPERRGLEQRREHLFVSQVELRLAG